MPLSAALLYPICDRLVELPTGLAAGPQANPDLEQGRRGSASHGCRPATDQSTTSVQIEELRRRRLRSRPVAATMIPVVRAVGIWQFGGPEVLQIVELPEPTPRACEICVRVIASTVNPADTGLRCGQFAGLLGDTQPPYVGGLEFAGVIEAVGPGSDWSVGDVVAALTSPFPGGRGSHAERVVVHARAATAVPDGIGLEAAATVPMNGMTARISLDTLGLAAGATVAITGAAGAVGAYATELAHAEGLRVIAVASREDASWLEELGADAVVERGPEAAEDIRRVAPSGVDGLIDAALVGEPAFAAVADGGVFIVLREFSVAAPRGIRVERVSVRTHGLEQTKLERLMQMATTGQLTPRVSQTYAPEAAAEAHRHVERPGTRGRAVLRFEG